MKIIVWQTAFLGDLILTTPLLHSIKNIYPDSELSIITKPFGKEILKNNPFVENIIIYDKKIMSNWELIKQIKKEKYDIAISPHRSHRASYSLFLAGIPVRIGFDRSGFSFLYTKTVPHRFNGIHEIERNLSLLTKLENYSKEKLYNFPELFLTKEEEETYKNYSLVEKQYITIAPGSKWNTKRWTEIGFSETINFLTNKFEKVVLIGGNEDSLFTERILKNIKNKNNVLNLVGKTSLRESFSIIKHSKALISNDSAPVHIAVAFNIPVVDIYGPTIKEFGFYPYRNGIVVEVKNLDCRPCGLHGHNKCPKKHFKCMKEISPIMVINALNSILQSDY